MFDIFCNSQYIDDRKHTLYEFNVCKGIYVMKKKKVIIFMIAAILVLFCIGGFLLIQPPKLNADSIRQIEFISLPSPPKKKIITQKEDIQKIVSVFNELNLTPRIPISNPAGTSVWINTSGEQQTYQITMTASIVQINALSYRCNEDAAEKMRILYRNDYQQ